MPDLPPGVRGIRFYSGRRIPIGTKLRTSVIGPIFIVEGSVPGGPHVATACAVIENEIVLDDNLFFEHEMGQKKLRL